MIDVLRAVLLLALGLLTAMMWARLALDYARFFAPSWRPRGAILVLCEGVYTVTDPPIKAVRRILPPIRLGGVGIDLAWMVVMLAIAVLNALVSSFVR